ncbi:hypothetical protein O3P69_012443 [Scylla paramamosain]|uniref:Reverse transcriptase domain-containing protein n=1 Tax=Scylla paramamosain TaxID=85552 RepID=A0AAW0SD37_SCYPA
MRRPIPTVTLPRTSAPRPGPTKHRHLTPIPQEEARHGGTHMQRPIPTVTLPRTSAPRPGPTKHRHLTPIPQEEARHGGTHMQRPIPTVTLPRTSAPRPGPTKHRHLTPIPREPRSTVPLPSLLLTNPTSLTNKFDELSVVVKQEDPDIIAISETWFSVNKPAHQYEINGYDLFHKNRDTRGGGGPLYICPPIGLSRHKCVLVRPATPASPPRHHAVQYRPYKESSMREFGSWITAVDWSFLETYPSIEQQENALHAILQHQYEAYFPLETWRKRESDQPWMTPEIKRLIVKKRNAYNKGNTERYRACPDRWKQSTVIALPKVADVTNLGQLRPVSLTHTFGKVVEGRVADVALTDKRPHIDGHQFGNLKGRSTTQYMVFLLDAILKGLEQRNTVAQMCLIDFKNAFDNVDHSVAVTQLYNFGCRTSFLPFISSFLTGRQQRTKYKDKTSTWLPTTCGVPQGTCIGPVIFLALINSLLLILSEFVDDVLCSR